MGATVEGRIELKPEEALYLLECSQLGAVQTPKSIKHYVSVLNCFIDIWKLYHIVLHIFLKLKVKYFPYPCWSTPTIFIFYFYLVVDLSYDEVPVSIQQGYTALVGGGDCTLQEYLVYARLMKLGYKVVRHQGDLGVTEYERRVGLDQYQTKRKGNKRRSGQIKPVEGTSIFAGTQH